VNRIVLWSSGFGWVLFAAALFYYRISHLKRLHLNYYVVYLLLSEEVRTSQRLSFEKWLQASKAANEDALAFDAVLAIEQIADRLAEDDPKKDPAYTSTVLGSKTLLWNTKLRLTLV
jgi:hypothetical protein